MSSLRHVGHLPRRFPSALPVDNIGYVPRKTSWVRFEFSTYNFSFILSGEGEYWHEGRCWPVRAPCVITQAPGLFLEYGPTGERGEWEELYLIYNRARIPVLEKRGLIRRGIPAWNIKDIGPTRARLLELSRAMGDVRDGTHFLQGGTTGNFTPPPLGHHRRDSLAES
ncbi:MAG: hypothetical protein WCG36_03890 [bacterium]